ILPPVDRRADRRPPGRSERGPRRPGAEGGGAEAASRSEAVLRAATPRGTLRGGGTRRRSGGSWRWCRYPCPEPPQAFPGGPVDPGSAAFLAEAFEEPDRLLGLARARQRLGLVEPLLAGGQRRRHDADRLVAGHVRWDLGEHRRVGLDQDAVGPG